MLRPYQQEAHQTLGELYAGGDSRMLTVMATGLGKTMVASFLPETFPELANYGVLFLVHRKELVEQAANTFRQVWPNRQIGIEMGMYRANRYADVVVSSIQTLGREGSKRIRKFGNRFGIIVTDEAHHIHHGSQYERVLDFYGVGPNHRFPLPCGLSRLHVGITATPNRNDGKGLQKFFDDIAVEYDIRWGIENGYLVDIVPWKIQTTTDISEIKTQRGDFAVNQLSEAVDTHLRNDVAAKAFIEYGGQRAIAFCVDIQHAVNMADQFREYGIQAQAVHSKMEKDDRDAVIQAFRNGAIQVLTNCAITTEGFDSPETDTIIMARPTKSEPLFQQMVGRGTRPLISPVQPTAEERVQAIRDSTKPYMRVLELTDNVGRHEIVSTAALFGLDPAFDTEGNSITFAVQAIEEEEAVHPEKNVRAARTLDEVKIIASRLSIHDIARSPEKLGGITPHKWMDLGRDVYSLSVPAEFVGAAPCNFWIRLESDRLGRYTARRLEQPVFEQGQMVRPPREVAGTQQFSSRDEAIRYYDQYVKHHFPATLRLIRNNELWQNQPASTKQLALLKRMKSVRLSPQELSGLTKGDASDLITAAKMQHRSNRT